LGRSRVKLRYTFLSEQWELDSIRSLEDGIAAMTDSKKQVFLFDDFLGKVALERQAPDDCQPDAYRRTRDQARLPLTSEGWCLLQAVQPRTPILHLFRLFSFAESLLSLAN